MRKNVEEAVNMTLTKAAEKHARKYGCIMFWGETEIPACLKEEVKRSQMKNN